MTPAQNAAKWRMVPVEPTPAQLNAGYARLTSRLCEFGDKAEMIDLYAAMLSAAPAPPLVDTPLNTNGVVVSEMGFDVTQTAPAPAASEGQEVEPTADEIGQWLEANCGRGLPYGEATDQASMLHGLAYVLRQIEGTNSYRPNIGQTNSATSAIRMALTHFAKAALARAGGDGWRGIESAPKDGTHFDAWVPDAFGGKRMTGLSFNRKGQLRQHGLLTADDLPRWPTHWRPLPAAPDVGEG